MLATACVEEGLVLCVDSTEAEPSDEIDLALTMARDDAATGALCRPASQSVAGAELPYCVAVAPGSRYAVAALLRAEQRRGGVLLARRELLAPFRAGEQDEHDVVLVPTCEGAPCGTGEQCLPLDRAAPACVAVPRPGAFEGPTDDVACDGQ